MQFPNSHTLNGNQYEARAQAFLRATGSTLVVKQDSTQSAPIWADGKGHGVKYIFTLRNIKGVLEGDFWGSIHDAEKRIPVKAYDVLACLFATDDSFEDFCTNFGYSDDSIKALQTWEEVARQSELLRLMYTVNELKTLERIQ